MGRGYTWLDTGTYESLANATNFVRTIEERQGLLVGSPEEAAYRNNWLSKSQIGKIKKKYKNSFYADYLFQIIGN